MGLLCISNPLSSFFKPPFRLPFKLSFMLTSSSRDLLKNNFEFPSADLVIGGFPCQPFSQCGKREGFEDTNDRGLLYQSFANVVRNVKPKMFVAENVYGLLIMKSNPIHQIITDTLTWVTMLNIRSLNQTSLPQTRKRVIITGVLSSNDLSDDWNVITENKCECNIGKYFEHLSEPVKTKDISQAMYSKSKRRFGCQGQTKVNFNSFAPTMRAEHHGNIECSEIRR